MQGDVGGEGGTRLRPHVDSGFASRLSRLSPPALLCIVLFAGLFIHSRALGVGYLADDYDLLYAVTRPEYSVWDRFPAGTGTYYRPAVTFSLYLERSAGGGPAIHHLVNVGLTFLAAGLVFVLIYTLNGSKALAAILSALFLFHRASVPAVYWISGRVESLLAVGILGCLLAAAAYVRGRNRGLGFSAFLTCLFLALLSKESALILPIVLFIVLRHTREDSELRRKSATFLIRTSSVVVITYAVFVYVRFYGGASTLTLAQPAEMIRGLARCGLLAIWPVSEWRLQSASAFTLALAGVTAGIVMLVGTGRNVLAVWRLPVVLFIVSLAPILIVQGGGGVRQLYVPIALTCVGLALTLHNDPDSSRRIGFLAAALAVWSSLSSFSAASEWVRNNEIAASCCLDFRRIVSTNRSDVTLLTSPRSIGDAPVFSNDARAALHYCRTGAFGYDRGVYPVAEMVMGHPAPAIPVPDSVGFERRIPRAAGWFVHPYLGEVQLTREAKLTVLIPGEFTNQSHAFRFTLSENHPDRPTAALEFNGSGFSLAVKSPDLK